MKDPHSDSLKAIASIEYDRLDPEDDDYADTQEALAEDARQFYGEQRYDAEREG